MKLNINKHLNLEDLNDPTYFFIPILDESMVYATHVTISLISNPHNCSFDFIQNLLQQFFSSPKYLRSNDIISVNVQKYVPEIKCNTIASTWNTLHFRINKIYIKNKQLSRDGGFAIYSITRIIQNENKNSYFPRKCLCDIAIHIEESLVSKWVPIWNKLIEEIQLCVSPFLQKDICIHVKPIFLMEGPAGSGKSLRIKILAEILGLHLLIADFVNIQCPTFVKTEQNLQQILSEAEKCKPCILMLQNIHIFGVNSQGQKNEKVLQKFETEIDLLYSEKREYPIIIIATSDISEIPIDTEKIFTEIIAVKDLEEEDRYQLLSWFIESKGLKHQADLQQISKMCSNFVLADLEALVLYATKNRYKIVNSSNESDILELFNEDFIFAYEYMKSLFSNEIGSPHVPKVHWEDIGALADVKHEIIRRIKMSSLNISGLNKSGILLYGPPGTGKTLLAKAVATECQLHFLTVKGPELLNMYIGQSEKNIRKVFERARSAAPCIIFFDELDSLAPKRSEKGNNTSMHRVVSQLLVELDGLEDVSRIFVIGATNRPDLIDPALLRPGRFDKMLYVGVCSDPDSRLSILKALTRRFKMEKHGQELETLVHQLPDNLTGADLSSVCSKAWLRAVHRTLANANSNEKLIDDVIVRLDDFVQVSGELVPSVSKEELIRYKKLENQLSWK
ncbi:PREDICTED: peroxisome assembly factor 2 [Ceratosolen solmsi marchali]|uniref:Peroxisomal ATPase PEX6 n=1 Tax=Ceratosolen solmsi marchali TaxID=326594 RepID=A0AAJ6VKA7_9HYME|nr:PREDICTED: peroxisome assembly factor 2 [Ceratosolen solmsi marchali]